jgi:hypothetical protein
MKPTPRVGEYRRADEKRHCRKHSCITELHRPVATLREEASDACLLGREWYSSYNAQVVD